MHTSSIAFQSDTHTCEEIQIGACLCVTTAKDENHGGASVKLKGDVLQSEERLAIGSSQTTLGDRLQPSLTASSMFNAACWVLAGSSHRPPPLLRRSAVESVAGGRCCKRAIRRSHTGLGRSGSLLSGCCSALSHSFHAKWSN